MEFETDDPTMLVEMAVTFRPPATGNDTDLLALHENVPPGASPTDNEVGWSNALDKLARLVEGSRASETEVARGDAWHLARGGGQGATPLSAAQLKRRAKTRPIMLHVSAVARHAWALPATLAGLLLSLIAIASGAKGRLVDGVVEIAGGRIDACVLMLPRRCRFGAITFGHVIIGVDHQTLAHHRPHEHVHVRQYERWGVLFFPLYLGSSLLQIARGRDPYLGNAFEREAFANSVSCEPRPDPGVNLTDENAQKGDHDDPVAARQRAAADSSSVTALLGARRRA